MKRRKSTVLKTINTTSINIMRAFFTRVAYNKREITSLAIYLQLFESFIHSVNTKSIEVALSLLLSTVSLVFWESIDFISNDNEMLSLPDKGN